MSTPPFGSQILFVQIPAQNLHLSATSDRSFLNKNILKKKTHTTMDPIKIMGLGPLEQDIPFNYCGFLGGRCNFSTDLLGCEKTCRSTDTNWISPWYLGAQPPGPLPTITTLLPFILCFFLMAVLFLAKNLLITK